MLDPGSNVLERLNSLFKILEKNQEEGFLPPYQETRFPNVISCHRLLKYLVPCLEVSAVSPSSNWFLFHPKLILCGGSLFCPSKKNYCCVGLPCAAVFFRQNMSLIFKPTKSQQTTNAIELSDLVFFLSRFRRSQGGQALPLPAISGDFEKPVARDNPPTLALHNCIKKENHPKNMTLDGANIDDNKKTLYLNFHQN